MTKCQLTHNRVKLSGKPSKGTHYIAGAVEMRGSGHLPNRQHVQGLLCVTVCPFPQCAALLANRFAWSSQSNATES